MWFLKLLPLLLGCAASSIVPVNETTSKSNTELTKPLLDREVDQNVFSLVRDERRLYLEDVFYSIKSMDWTEEEHLCLNQTLDLLSGLQNFSLWAVAMWDATASDARGVLYGSSYQLGNFDECVKPAWTTEHARLTTQYCLAEVKLIVHPRNLPKYKRQFSPFQSALDKIYYTGDPTRRPLNTLTWGSCVPAACPPRAVARLLTTLLHRSSLAAAGLGFNVTVDNCQTDDSDQPLPADTVAFFAVLGILSAVATACTFIDWRREKFSDDVTRDWRVVKAFSFMSNLRMLTTRNEGGLDVLYGIRYLSICLIVLCHRYGMFTAGPLSNGLEADEYFQHPAYSIFLVHDDLFVDTFFFMSGLLVSKSLLSMKRFPNFFILVLKRYVRLAPALGVVMWYMSSVFSYSGSGPLWPRTVEAEVLPCRRNWWLNMLMLSNYVHAEDMCILSTWYIPCDFHFFLAATWLCYLARRSLGRWLCAAVPLATLAVVVPGVVTAYYRLPAVLLFVYSFLVNARANETFLRMYIQSHTRAGSYIVGIGVGYLITKVYPIADTRKMSMIKSSACAGLGILIMFLVMTSGCIFYMVDKPYNVTEAAVYAALNRPAFTAGVAIFVLSCVYGNVPLVTSLLSWSPWVPLSKLAYGLYLVHMAIIGKDVSSARDPNFFNLPILLHRALGDIMWGTFFALILWLIVEAPCTNLLSICLSPTKSSSHATEGESNKTETIETERQSTSRFKIPQEANLPSASDILRSKF